LLEDTDELLVIDPLELDYVEGSSAMYEDGFSLDEDYLSIMRYILFTPNDSD